MAYTGQKRIDNIPICREFYIDILGCEEGRSSDHWIDYNFFGHQLVVHLDDKINPKSFNTVDGKNVPIPHFGLVLNWKDWILLKEKLKKAHINFIIKPYIRFKGKVGEQATMFFLDPSGNALEFKAFNDDNQIFAK